MTNKRNPVLAGNWKMHKNINEAVKLAQAIKDGLRNLGYSPEKLEVILGPSFVALQAVKEVLKNTSLKLAAQNVFYHEKGAYTGEVSPLMLAELANYVIVGHSERRHLFGETNEAVNLKIKACQEKKLPVIFCVGESAEIREKGETWSFIQTQLEKGLEAVKEDFFNSCLLAYEPVWAIGSGQAATPEQAQEVIEQIRHWLGSKYSLESAGKIRILYGGSTKPVNVKGFLNEKDIDGALVGGASLESEKFVAMAKKII